MISERITGFLSMIIRFLVTLKMSEQELIGHLSVPPGKKKTQALASVITDPRQVLELTFCPVPELAFRAAWLLEHIAVEYPENFASIAPQFMKVYSSQTNPGGRRHFSRIMMDLSSPGAAYSIPGSLCEEIIEASFEWLIDPKTPVAIKANCMDVLLNLRHTADWITDELGQQVSFVLKDGGPAILSRGKRVMAKLDRAKRGV